MSAPLEPITIFGHEGGAPNPPKVFILAKLLGLPYTFIPKDMKHDPEDPNSIKHPSYLAVNPNGRVPAIIDPNQDNIAVWESAAILQYLAEVYDKDFKYSGKNLQERTLINSWLAFQISGQGPMQGQAIWFTVPAYHKAVYGEAPDHVAQRFRNEMHRVYSVVETQLEKQKANGSDWLVTDRLTIVDIAWITWARGCTYVGIDLDTFPNLRDWIARIEAIPEAKEVFEQFQLGK
ncbi:hypothetical protein DRE_01463 [Drechslerella stenobrocha 248]|uniref:Glutathione S-transferase n=1 Tax=Drechslerella stenobrocha 248 TaxID=1043628 RepID=W7HI83_9PEZI|nr:hypothetical protein DRE_01463 [Drechslerella stenobrocha 248]